MWAGRQWQGAGSPSSLQDCLGPQWESQRQRAKEPVSMRPFQRWWVQWECFRVQAMRGEWNPVLPWHLGHGARGALGGGVYMDVSTEGTDSDCQGL